MVEKLGADATIDYRKSEDDQLQDLKSITGGNFFGVYDTVAKSIAFAARALKEISTSKEKIFVTTDDWSEFFLFFFFFFVFYCCDEKRAINIHPGRPNPRMTPSPPTRSSSV